VSGWLLVMHTYLYYYQLSLSHCFDTLFPVTKTKMKIFLSVWCPCTGEGFTEEQKIRMALFLVRFDVLIFVPVERLTI